MEGAERVVVVVVVAVVVDSSFSAVDSSFSAQEMMARLKRNMEKMMSICLTWFPNWLVLGEPELYHHLV